MSDLNWIDIIILAIFFFSILSGFARGFIREALSLVTLIAAFIIATMFSNALASAFTSHQVVQGIVSQTSSVIGVSTHKPVSYLALGISFGALFAATIIVGSIASYILNIAFQTGILGLGNRLLGGAFGFVRGYIFNLVLIFIVQLTPLGTEPWWHQSRFVNSYQNTVVWLGSIVSPSLAHLKDRFNETIKDAGSHIGSHINGAASSYIGK